MEEKIITNDGWDGNWFKGNSPARAIKENAGFFGVQGFANLIGVNSAHVSNVVNGCREPSPTIIGKLRSHGIVPPMKKRVRISADLQTEERRELLQRGSKILGFESWGHFVNSLAEEWEELEQFGDIESLGGPQKVKVLTVNSSWF